MTKASQKKSPLWESKLNDYFALSDRDDMTLESPLLKKAKTKIQKQARCCLHRDNQKNTLYFSDREHIVFNGNKLNDGQTIAEQNIQPGSTLHLISRDDDALFPNMIPELKTIEASVSVQLRIWEIMLRICKSITN